MGVEVLVGGSTNIILVARGGAESVQAADAMGEGGPLDMKGEEIRRLIQRGQLERIGSRVEVEFDNRQQAPLSFRYGGQRYEVLELIWTEQPSLDQYHYMVRTRQGVYNLVLVRENPAIGISPSAWWLDFRVRTGGSPTLGEAKPLETPRTEVGFLGPGFALVKGELLGVTAFHGHLCPELALGYRAAMIARAKLGFGRQESGSCSVVMYASSSAADAIQYLTGCTVGKGNLLLEDTGDQIFCFLNRKGQLLLKLLPGALDQPQEFHRLQEKVERGQVSPRELAWYQAEVDRLVKRILELPDEALFAQVLLLT